MKVYKFKSDKLVSIPINKYLIDWDADSCSKLQTKCKQLLRPFWSRCLVLEECRIPGCLLRIDFICLNKKIAVEVSPISHHGTFNAFFHKNSRNVYKDSIKRDLDKLEWLEKNQFKLLELNEADLDQFSPRYIESLFGILII